MEPGLSPDSPLDVLIVGAGPAGLAVAMGLEHSGITNYRIVEQAMAFTPAGTVVDLLPNGLAALRAMYPPVIQAIREKKMALGGPPPPAASAAKTELVLFNSKGDPLQVRRADDAYWEETYGAPRIGGVPWFLLQQALRECIDEGRVLQTRTRCTRIKAIHKSLVEVEVVLRTKSKSDSSTDTLSFWQAPNPNAPKTQADEPPSSDDSEGTPTCLYAKLVVGADGAKSAVRRSLPGGVAPMYSGLGQIMLRNIRGMSQADLAKIDQTFSPGAPSPAIMAFGDNEEFEANLLLAKKLPGPPNSGIPPPQIAVLLLNLRLEEADWNRPGHELKQIGKAALRASGFPEAMLQAVECADEQSSYGRGYYYVNPSKEVAEIACKGPCSSWTEPVWEHHGRVVLVGDAAHGLPPVRAQGANLSFEGAYRLVKRLVPALRSESSHDLSEAIRGYVEEHSERASAIQRLTGLRWQQGIQSGVDGDESARSSDEFIYGMARSFEPIK